MNKPDLVGRRVLVDTMFQEEWEMGEVLSEHPDGGWIIRLDDGMEGLWYHDEVRPIHEA